MGAGSMIWGWDTANWQKVLVDAGGRLQVDVIASGLPLGAATAANQATIIGHIDGIEGALGQCYGYDGGAWQRLRVETAANANLRVALYGADSRAYVGAGSEAFTYATPGLITFATLYGDDGTNVSRVGMLLEGADAVVNTLNTLGVASMLYGFNGTTWDRLRVESDALFNLRVKLYDGANGIDSDQIDSNIFVSGERALLVRAQICGYNLEPFHQRRSDSDALGAVSRELCQFTISALYGFNGTTFDRLRSDSDKHLIVNSQFGGNVYSKTMTMEDNNPTRFETDAKKLRDIVIIVKTHPMLLGETGVEVYPVGANETIGWTKVDISTLYFKNAGADNHGVITILGVEE